MRLILAGTPAFAWEIFAPLLDDDFFEIVALICQPDKPFGRKAELKPPHTKAMLLQKIKTNLKQDSESMPHIFQPSSITQDFIENMQILKPDMILVVAYGKILPKAFLDIAPCINIHASILPLWRGASPLQQMILSQSPYFGISAMRMGEELDNGDILGISYVANTQQNITELSSQLAESGAKLATFVLKNFEKIEPLRQIDADSSYCTKIKKSDGFMCLESAQNVYKSYLAYCEWPHIFIQSVKGYTLKLFDVSLIESNESHNAGEILKIGDSSIVVGCRSGSLNIDSLQQEGKNRLEAALYLRGKHLKIGDVLC
ncbi:MULTISPECIES: methionyl-tRNA formyltransferase [Helicobacter]|mgnify:CR=1 FL=1|uniref:Methionyl-tRNA formyltransferase n=4 Tax=Helicobacter typhlonius TaxID=76936 RepID=A0A0S4PT07_9HELI|nr:MULTISPECIES: methionyl-tRNA formyltransferase [Helicobacter]TLD79467.1 methionyl-tRNA formyltransferase [Helicobacter typhlonius]TLD86642.1 methionyl-tRNA formyltransferase [Helicobacter sp. MIT 03-1616]CUU39423.1 Methionyl-tRNA formyltransferase [Helicobacter typhlonius]HCD72795.1 methionyl-tRNA formyltransferase [Helicobacter sp.]